VGTHLREPGQGRDCLNLGTAKPGTGAATRIARTSRSDPGLRSPWVAVGSRARRQRCLPRFARFPRTWEQTAGRKALRSSWGQESRGNDVLPGWATRLFCQSRPAPPPGLARGHGAATRQRLASSPCTLGEDIAGHGSQSFITNPSAMKRRGSERLSLLAHCGGHAPPSSADWGLGNDRPAHRSVESRGSLRSLVRSWELR
jgi:hypothetical protein